MSIFRIGILLLLTLGASGCVPLKEVQEYAAESAGLAADSALTTRFRDTYQRERPYLFGAADSAARVNDTRRKAAYGDLLRIHQTVAGYMETLARLAGDDTFDLSGELDALAGGISSYPQLGIDDAMVAAVANVAQVITRWALAAVQDRALREMVKQADPHLQTVLEGMISLVRYYRRTLYNERRTVLGFLETEIPFTNAPEDRLLAALGRAHSRQKTMEYDAVEPSYPAAERGLLRIAEGHRELVKNAGNLSSAEARQVIDRCVRDLRAVRKGLRSASQ